MGPYARAVSCAHPQTVHRLFRGNIGSGVQCEPMLRAVGRTFSAGGAGCLCAAERRLSRGCSCSPPSPAAAGTGSCERRARIARGFASITSSEGLAWPAPQLATALEISLRAAAIRPTSLKHQEGSVSRGGAPRRRPCDGASTRSRARWAPPASMACSAESAKPAWGYASTNYSHRSAGSAAGQRSANTGGSGITATSAAAAASVCTGGSASSAGCVATTASVNTAGGSLLASAA